MNKKVIIAVIAAVSAVAAVLAVFAAAGFIFFDYYNKNTSEELTLSGNVDIRQVNLSFRVGGRLKQLRVDEGAEVKEGDVLGLLDGQPYRLAFIEAQANQTAIAAQRLLYQQGYRKEDIKQAKDNLTSRLAAQAYAEQVLQRQKKLIGTGANSQRSLDDAESNFIQAKAQADAARQQHSALEKGFREEEVKQAEANYQRAQAQTQKAALQLADTVLKAPSDGIILTRAVEPGTLLNAGSSVLTLSLNQPVWVRAYVAEPNLGKVAPGTKVKVFTDSRTEPYDGVIGFVSPASEFTPKNVETTDLRTALVYRLRVVVERPDKQLRQGMPVTVKVPMS